MQRTQNRTIDIVMPTTVGSPLETLAKKEESLSFSGQDKKIRKEIKDPANTPYSQL
jgi:hypothetical protein